MWKASLIALAATTAALALAVGASAAGLPDPSSLPAGWTHVDINVMLNRAPHTVTLNRGRVQTATASALMLREADGQLVTVPVGGATQFLVNGRAASFADLRVGALAITWQVDGNPALRVRVQQSAKPLHPVHPVHPARRH